MPPIVEFSEKGKPQIKRVDTFCSLLNYELPSENSSFSGLLEKFDKIIKDKHPQVTSGALSN